MPLAVVKSLAPSFTMRKWEAARITGRSALGPASFTCTSWGPTALISANCSATVFTLEAVAASLWRASE